MKKQPGQMLDLPRLRKALDSATIGHTVHHYMAVPSTMPIAQQLCREHRISTTSTATTSASTISAPNSSALDAKLSGAIVVAEEQTEGRGRHRRPWTMPPSSGLAVSICLKAPHLPPSPAQLPMMAAVASLRAIESVAPAFSGQTRLKWPNDLLIGTSSRSSEGIQKTSKAKTVGVFKKVGGILIESSFWQGQLDYAIIGIGINVNQKLDALPPTPSGAPDATSIYASTGHVVDRTDLLIALCRQLSNLVGEEPSSIYQEWRASIHTLGQVVSIRQQDSSRESAPNTVMTYTATDEKRAEDNVLEGIAVDTTTDGGLVIEDQQGCRQTFYAGDVSIRSV